MRIRFRGVRRQDTIAALPVGRDLPQFVQLSVLPQGILRLLYGDRCRQRSQLDKYLLGRAVLQRHLQGAPRLQQMILRRQLFPMGLQNLNPLPHFIEPARRVFALFNFLRIRQLPFSDLRLRGKTLLLLWRVLSQRLQGLFRRGKLFPGLSQHRHHRRVQLLQQRIILFQHRFDDFQATQMLQFLQYLFSLTLQPDQAQVSHCYNSHQRFTTFSTIHPAACGILCRASSFFFSHSTEARSSAS